jgi:hypothetical protein
MRVHPPAKALIERRRSAARPIASCIDLEYSCGTESISSDRRSSRRRPWRSTRRSLRDRDGSTDMTSDPIVRKSGWFMRRLEAHPLIIGTTLTGMLAALVASIVTMLGFLGSR